MSNIDEDLPLSFPETNEKGLPRKGPPQSGGGTEIEKSKDFGIPRINQLPPDDITTKPVRRDQLEAIAMAPHDGIGGFGWASLGGLVASLPATFQDIWASYISKHAVALPPGRLVDVVVTAVFAAAFVLSFFKQKGATSAQLLAKIFPEPPAEMKK